MKETTNSYYDELASKFSPEALRASLPLYYKHSFPQLLMQLMGKLDPDAYHFCYYGHLVIFDLPYIDELFPLHVDNEGPSPNIPADIPRSIIIDDLLKYIANIGNYSAAETVFSELTYYPVFDQIFQERDGVYHLKFDEDGYAQFNKLGLNIKHKLFPVLFRLHPLSSEAQVYYHLKYKHGNEPYNYCNLKDLEFHQYIDELLPIIREDEKDNIPYFPSHYQRFVTVQEFFTVLENSNFNDYDWIKSAALDAVVCLKKRGLATVKEDGSRQYFLDAKPIDKVEDAAFFIEGTIFEEDDMVYFFPDDRPNTCFVIHENVYYNSSLYDSSHIVLNESATHGKFLLKFIREDNFVHHTELLKLDPECLSEKIPIYKEVKFIKNFFERIKSTPKDGNYPPYLYLFEFVNEFLSDEIDLDKVVLSDFEHYLYKYCGYVRNNEGFLTKVNDAQPASQ